MVTLTHLTKHIQYLQTTVDTLVQHSGAQHLDWRMECVKAQELLHEMKHLEESVDGLQQRIFQLKRKVSHICIIGTALKYIRDNVYRSRHIRTCVS